VKLGVWNSFKRKGFQALLCRLDINIMKRREEVSIIKLHHVDIDLIISYRKDRTNRENNKERHVRYNHAESGSKGQASN
jgi:hypothetical protein